VDKNQEIINQKKQIPNKKQTQKNNFQTSGKTDFFSIIFFVIILIYSVN